MQDRSLDTRVRLRKLGHIQKSEEIAELFVSRAQALCNMERCIEGCWQRLLAKKPPINGLPSHLEPPDTRPFCLAVPVTQLKTVTSPCAERKNQSPSPGVASQDSARCFGEDGCEDLEAASSKDRDSSPPSTGPHSTPKVLQAQAFLLEKEVVRALFQRMDDSRDSRKALVTSVDS